MQQSDELKTIEKLLKIDEDVKSEVFDLSEKVDAVESDLVDIKTDISTVKESVEVVKSDLIDKIDNISLTPGAKGDKGDTPTKEEIVNLIKPLIPEPIKGDKGDSIKGDSGRDGTDGLDANEDRIIEEVIKKIPIPENGKDGSPDTPKDIKTKLESLKGNDRLDASAIKNLPEQIVHHGGGGLTEQRASELGFLKIVAHDGTLTGDGTPSSPLSSTNSGNVISVVAGNNIDVDPTDPANPIVSATGLELELGNPLVSGQVLSSTDTGVRSWVDLAAGGAVDSVFGRTGDVVAEQDDYTWGQINKTTSDIADLSLKSHTSLTDIGTNSHADIDLHIGDSDIHEPSSELVHKAGGETITGLKTFDTVLPQSNLVPVDADDLVNKFYADSIALGFKFKPSVKVGTTEALPACTYDNGTLGVLATLTADVNGSLGLIDGYSLMYGESILVKDQANAAHNGIYIKTQAGDESNPWILTRRDDYDDDETILEGTATLVLQGTIQQATQWAMVSPDPIVVGTDNLLWVEIARQKVFSASNGVKIVVNDAQIDLSDLEPGLEIDNGGLQVKLDIAGGLDRSDEGLAVKVGGVLNNMLAGSITDSKLDSITSGSKVYGSALYDLPGIPFAAGIIPGQNLGSTDGFNLPDPTKFLRGDGKWETVPGGGGGINSVVAGDNIDVDNTDPSNPIISSTGGGGISHITLTGTIDDTNTTFTASVEPLDLVINGATYKKTGGAITWTYTSGTIELSSPVGQDGSIYGLTSGNTLSNAVVYVGATEPTVKTVNMIWFS